MAVETNKPNFQYVWASGGAKVTPSDVKIQDGWTAEVPPFQWENWSQNRQDEAILHLFQKGISEWDALSNYYFTAAGVRSYVQGSDGQIYVALQDSLNQNPTTATTYWKVAFPTSGRLLNVQVLVGAGTYTATAGTNKVRVRAVGGGGAGGGAASTAAGNLSGGVGGGAGAPVEGVYTTGFAGVSYSVGVGGVGVAAAGGGNGGTTTFGALITAPGGVGGGFAGNNAPPVYLGRSGNSATSTGGNVFNSEGNGGGPLTGPTTTFVTSGEGGASIFGGGAGPRGTTGAGVAAVSKGAGGSGAAAQPSNPLTYAGGNGAPGTIIVEEYA